MDRLGVDAGRRGWADAEWTGVTAVKEVKSGEGPLFPPVASEAESNPRQAERKSKRKKQ